MAELVFIYAAMDSGKSVQLLIDAHSSEEEGKKILCFTSEKDNRSGEIAPGDLKSKVSSRIRGLEREAWIAERVDIGQLIDKWSPDVAYVDEAQFMEEKHVRKFVEAVDIKGVDVYAYGLLTDFQSHLFPGSRALVEWADRMETLRRWCKICGKNPATKSMRIDEEGNPVFQGERLKVGGSSLYIRTCRRCYLEALERDCSQIVNNLSIDS